MSKINLDEQINNLKNFKLPSDFEESLSKATATNIKLATEGMQQLAKDLEDFEKKFEERQKLINKGARKTNGLIVWFYLPRC